GKIVPVGVEDDNQLAEVRVGKRIFGANRHGGVPFFFLLLLNFLSQILGNCFRPPLRTVLLGQSLRNESANRIFKGVVQCVEVRHFPSFLQNVILKQINVYNLALLDGLRMFNLNADVLQFLEFRFQNEVVDAEQLYIISDTHDSLSRFSRRLLKIALKTSISVVAGRFKLIVKESPKRTL